MCVDVRKKVEKTNNMKIIVCPGVSFTFVRKRNGSRASAAEHEQESRAYSLSLYAGKTGRQ